MDQPLDAIIVGAGLSGLAAARCLERAGASYLVLEARDRVGGRTLSQPLAGVSVDLGGQWIGPTQDRVLALVSELRVPTFEQHHRGRKILSVGGRRRTYGGFLPPVSLASLAEMGWALGRLERLARKVPLDSPWTAGQAAGWDATDLESWIGRAFWTRGARTMLRIAAQVIFAAEPRELSLLFFLFYLHSGGGLRRLGEIRGGAQQTRILGGAQQIAERLAALLGLRVVLERPVTAVEQDEAGVTLHGAGASWRARRLILAIPPALCSKIDFRPVLPAARLQLQGGMPMGSVIKCIAAYPQAFWRRGGLSGEALCDVGPVRAVFDDCSEGGLHPALVAFVFGDEARRLSQASAESRQTEVLTALGQLFGPEALRPAAYVDKDWTTDPYSGGCYVGILPPRVLGTAGHALRAPVGRIHFAGTETATRWMGYMDGALEAGDRAAAEILEALRSPETHG